MTVKRLRTPSGSTTKSHGVTDFRLRRHHLRDARGADPVTICRDICGAQAQVMSAAYAQLWTRNHAIRRTDVEDALWKSRTLAKTSLMRQTIHLIAADEFPMYIAALEASRTADALRAMARCGIEREEAEELTARILEALADGPLRRPDIVAAVRPHCSARVREFMKLSWSHVRVPVARGLVCYGPAEGKEVRFIRTDQWLPKRKKVAAADAQRALLRGYLRAYGPATVNDFAHWSGIRMKECRAAFEGLRGELLALEDGTSLLAEDRDALDHGTKKRGEVNLLPAFDPFLLAHSEKDHLLEGVHYKRVYRSQGWISPVVLLDGSVVATWSHKVRGGEIAVNVEPFEALSRAARRGVESEVKALADFHEKQLTLRIP